MSAQFAEEDGIAFLIEAVCSFVVFAEEFAEAVNHDDGCLFIRIDGGIKTQAQSLGIGDVL